MAKKHDDKGRGEDDGDLFRRTFQDAAPLKRRRRIAPVDPPSAAKPAIQPAPKRSARKQAATPPAIVPPPAAPPAPMPAVETPTGGLAGIDRRTADRLRRGKLAIEARIDLHGMFQEDAHRALDRFIAESAARGRRVVLVITGKGRVSEGGGVLRRNVPMWLRLPACAPHVLAAVPAQPQHGGAGALYVMLRRKRD